MQVKTTALKLLVALFPFAAGAQTTYLPLHAKENVLLERLEIKAGTDSVLNFSKTRPLSRKAVVPQIEGIEDLLQSESDRYNWYSAMAGNLEWISGDPSGYESKKPIWKHFYKTPANLYEVNTEDFYLALNPIVQYNVSKERNNDQHLFLNSRGLSLRGRIANKVGFAAYLTENQERDPLYVQRWVAERKAVPNQGYYQNFKGTGYDYFDARGYFSVNAAKYIDISFGYDRNFIGNGQRSLFLSDFSNNTLFLKLNTRIWKFNYQNIFMELQATEPRGADRLLKKKYAAMHHLDLAVTRWLNIGLFEGVVFGRPNRFDFTYLNPIIFLRSVEQQNGSNDNAVAGIDFKANTAKRFQFYGQLLLDEFKLKELRDNRGWWANKWGWQLGAKYIDVLGINNLDLQVEANRVRPFTYSHDDSIANYTHYNQPLAHPIGANFQEVMGVLRYQPIPRLTLNARGMYYFQGRDSSAASFGSNIFLPNSPQFRDGKVYGFNIGSGLRTDVAMALFNVSYELKQNMFLEAGATIRNEKPEGRAARKTTIVSAGFRWNMGRREFWF
ncbi:hypothetical protein [Pseudocnuella soli]|uniref:hypothetical protein n=1 Tax=Pseudocnuella soli TaxID=2502779 RepID=UPI00104F3574|nr:hypothetical protein [Pseudocnuella soli]